MTPFAQRNIERALLEAASVPVVILEGARAVGKTTLMKTSIAKAGYSYTSLADPGTLRFARTDPDGWLRRLKRPAVIDEAQLLPELPLLLKELTDSLGPGSHFILTGSASIGRSSLGGSDPLTRRSRRLKMSPLTTWEIEGQDGAIADLLFDAFIATGSCDNLSDEAVLHDMRVGGFPSYVFPNVISTQAQRNDRIRSDLTAVLSDDVLPGRGFDTTIAKTVLDTLLRAPGGMFNASRIAQTHDLDRRTVDRYLSLFERVFLLHWLPNLATGATRQSHARSKIHPVDTSFSVESLVRSGVRILDEREKFGALLESHVVNQIVASVQWSQIKPDAYFWRQASDTSPEVDLVLMDSVGRVVGIEVKAARSVQPRDVASLRALDRDRGLHRGFIFYTGNEVLQLDDNIWALPVSTLSDAAVFNREPAAPLAISYEVKMEPSVSSGGHDASMFLSYVHADNERASGRMVKFARDLVDTYDYLYGHTIDLFVDRDDISWGQEWSERLQTEAESTSFLLSIVTPRYLTSAACRKEVLDFAAAADDAQEPRLLLPLQWIDIAETDVVAGNDPVLTKIRQTQWEDVTEIRQIEPDSIPYEKLLERVAGRLKQTIDNRARGINPYATHPATDADDRDLLEVQESLESRNQEFEAAAAQFKDAFAAVAGVFQGRPPLSSSQTYGAAQALASLGADLRKPVGDLEIATEALGKVWSGYDSDMSRASLILGEFPDPNTRRAVFESLDSLANTLELPGADDMEQMLTVMGSASRHLRPMSGAFSAALRLLRGIQFSARTWRDRISTGGALEGT